MSWFKVDDKFYDHPKVRQAGAKAIGVWLLCGTWSAHHETDGFVPESVLRRWGTKKEANLLCTSGLWRVDQAGSERGWRFHDWSDFQPTKANREEARKTKAEAGRLGGQASGRSRREAKTKQPASRLVEAKRTPVPVPVPVTSSSLLSKSDLARIAGLTGGGEAWALKQAEFILSKTTAEIRDPLAYVLRAIENDPTAYKFRRGNPKSKADMCPTHVGEWRDNCRCCAAERIAARSGLVDRIAQTFDVPAHLIDPPPPEEPPPPMDDDEPHWTPWSPEFP